MITPLYSATPIGSVSTKRGDVLQITRGLDRPRVKQLIAYSLDESDRELAVTSDRTRFTSDSYESWYAHGRTPYGAIDGNGTLAGVVWLGPKPLTYEGAPAGEWHTVAYRSYGTYRGAGFMKPFCQTVFTDYLTVHQNATLYAKISCGNEASMHLARSLGFVETYTDRTSNPSVILIRP